MRTERSDFIRALVQASHDHLRIRLFDFTGVAALGTESANPSGGDDDLATRRAQVNALRAHDTAAVAAILAADTGKVPQTES